MTSVPPRDAEPSPRLILASSSPRRHELLREAGYDFLIHPADVDEAALSPGHLPIELAIHLSLAKARAVSEKFPADFILAADTIVAFGDQVLGKPTDPEHARSMLTLLAGTTHIVITGVALLRHPDGLSLSQRAFSLNERVLSAVQMKPLTPDQINAYVASNDWRGKAGGYGIQDPDPFVVRLRGCHTNIVGLPMTTTRRMLQSAGILPRA